MLWFLLQEALATRVVFVAVTVFIEIVATDFRSTGKNPAGIVIAIDSGIRSLDTTGVGRKITVAVAIVQGHITVRQVLEELVGTNGQHAPGTGCDVEVTNIDAVATAAISATARRRPPAHRCGGVVVGCVTMAVGIFFTGQDEGQGCKQKKLGQSEFVFHGMLVLGLKEKFNNYARQSHNPKCT